MDFLNKIDSQNMNSDDITKINPTITHKPMPLSVRLRLSTNDNKIENTRCPPVVQQENSHINQPEKVSNMVQLKPNAKQTKAFVNESTLKSEQNTTTSQINCKKVFQKGGKMFIIDPLQKILKKQSLLKPQVSLLKAQGPVSLLKPILNGNSSSKIPCDHDYSKFGVSKEMIIKKIHNQSFSNQLESKFGSIKFSTVRYAIDFLLRKLPLISRMASDYGFKSCYPFIVSSLEEYQKLGKIKKFAHEWLRSKYIRKCLLKHNNLKHVDIWTTKEILIYSRQHAFLPVIQNMNFPQDEDSEHHNYSNLSMIIKNEIKTESLNVQTLSLCHKVFDWINSVDMNVDKKHTKIYNQIIDVDNINLKNAQNHTLDTAAVDSESVAERLFMGIHENLESESLLVSSLTKDIGIRLQNEFIGKSKFTTFRYFITKRFG